jgi:hypothetical protein
MTHEMYVEVWKNPKTGEWTREKDLPEDATNDDGDITWEHREVTITCEGYYRYVPAKLSGPPEDCYPEESDGEITGWESDTEGVAPTKEELDEAFQAIVSSCHSGRCNDDYEPDPPDSYRDCL